jgi:hypothetical protein
LAVGPQAKALGKETVMMETTLLSPQLHQQVVAAAATMKVHCMDLAIRAGLAVAARVAMVVMLAALLWLQLKGTRAAEEELILEMVHWREVEVALVRWVEPQKVHTLVTVAMG